MRSLTIHTQKGGAGKTSFIGLLASMLAFLGKKILVIDFDSSQGNMILWTHGSKYQPKYEIGDYLMNLNTKDKINLKEIIIKVRDNFDLAPTFNINSSMKTYINQKINSDDELYSIGTLLEEAELLGYDFVLFDLAPSLLTLEKRVMYFVDEVIPITPCSYFGIQGVSTNNNEFKLLETNLKRIRKNPIVRNKLIINNVDFSSNEPSELLPIVKNMPFKSFTISTSTLVNKWQKQGIFITESKSKHKIKDDYLNVAKAILEEAV